VNKAEQVRHLGSVFFLRTETHNAFGVRMEISSFDARTPRGAQGRMVLPCSIAQARTRKFAAGAVRGPRETSNQLI